MTHFTIQNYDHDGIALSLSGARDEDECAIHTITAADSRINLIEIFPVNTVLSMAERVDAQLAREWKQQGARERAKLQAFDHFLSSI